MGSLISLLTPFAPLAVRIIGAYLDRVNADAETRQAYINFAERASKYFTRSAALHQSMENQKARIEAARKAAQNGNP